MGILQSITPCDIGECDRAASFLQSGFWGAFKQKFAWQAHGFIADWGIFGSLPVLVMTRPLAAGFGFAYVPWGPELPDDFPQAEMGASLCELAAALQRHLPKHTAFIRFDPPWFVAASISKPFTRAAADIQAPDTVILDISPPPAAILAQMKPKWRYNVRLGGKKVVVRRAEIKDLAVFYTIFKETARRDGIAVHGIEYYRALFELSGSYQGGMAADVRLYLADYENETLAGIITLFRGTQGTYLYGASSNAHRNVMAPHALQWQAILDAKAVGCTSYDLFGIPPDDNPNHPMAGLYPFKTGFGGKIIHRPGSWDYPYKGAVKTLFTAAEKFRKNLRDRKKANMFPR